MTISVGALAITWGLQSWLYHEQEKIRYTPVAKQREMQMTEWRQRGWAEQPETRHDTRGRNHHPLNLQYAGDLATLSNALAERGWQPAERLDWKNVLKLLSPSLNLQELPILPQVHDGRHEALLLKKDLAGDRRTILRLWSTNLRLAPGSIPLWVGNVSSQEPAHLLGLIQYPRTGGDFAKPFEGLLKDIGNLPHRLPAERPNTLLLFPIRLSSVLDIFKLDSYSRIMITNIIL